MLEEIAEFTRLYNYLGRSDMCFRDNIGDFSNCLRNNRVCLNTNLDYWKIKMNIQETVNSHSNLNYRYYNKFWNKDIESGRFVTEYCEYDYHMKYAKISLIGVGVTAIGLYFFFKN